MKKLEQQAKAQMDQMEAENKAEEAKQESRGAGGGRRERSGVISRLDATAARNSRRRVRLRAS